MLTALLASAAVIASLPEFARSARSLNFPVAFTLRFVVQSNLDPSGAFLDRTGRSCAVFPRHNFEYETLQGFAATQPDDGMQADVHVFATYSEQQRVAAWGKTRTRYSFTGAFVVVFRVPF